MECFEAKKAGKWDGGGRYNFVLFCFIRRVVSGASDSEGKIVFPFNSFKRNVTPIFSFLLQAMCVREVENPFHVLE